jgi:PAS domain S-box-containing protein
MENLELMHEIIDTLPFATLVVTPPGDIVWWNKTSEQIFGWKSSEVIDRPNPIVPRNRLDEFRAFQEIALTGRMLRAESIRQRKDGALIDVKTTMVPLRNRSGAIKHILILHEPVSEPVFLISKKADLPAWEAPASAASRMREPSSATLARFTPRQREIILQVARGRSNRQIAKSLSLGEQQIKNYLRGIYREIRVANRTELVVWLNEQRQRRVDPSS